MEKMVDLMVQHSSSTTQVDISIHMEQFLVQMFTLVQKWQWSQGQTMVVK